MKSRMAAFVVLVVLILVHANGQKQAEPAGLKKLSLDEVMEQLRLYPQDS